MKVFCAIHPDSHVTKQPIYIRVNAVSVSHGLTKAEQWFFNVNGCYPHYGEAMTETTGKKVGFINDRRVFVPVTPSMNQNALKVD